MRVKVSEYPEAATPYRVISAKWECDGEVLGFFETSLLELDGEVCLAVFIKELPQVQKEIEDERRKTNGYEPNPPD